MGVEGRSGQGKAWRKREEKVELKAGTMPVIYVRKGRNRRAISGIE